MRITGSNSTSKATDQRAPFSVTLSMARRTSISKLRFSAEVSPVKRVTGVDLLPSSLDLIELQEEISALRVADRNSTKPVELLRDAVAPVMPYYDYVLIDCPPNLGPITLNGLGHG